MIEKEMKMMLTECEFERAYGYLEKVGESSKIVQINYYFDTGNFDLYKSNRTLRVRQKEGTLQVQFKYNKKYKRGVRECNEWCRDLKELPFEISKEMLLDAEELEYNNFFLYGSMVTERYNFSFENVTVSLDKNYYCGTRDWEIEIEFYGENVNLREWKQKLKMSNEDETQGKYERFVEQFRSNR